MSITLFIDEKKQRLRKGVAIFVYKYYNLFVSIFCRKPG